MAALDNISELIEEGSRFTYENFASKGEYGYPIAYSEDWIVWTHYVQQVAEQIGSSSMAGKSITRGLEAELLGNGQDDYVRAIGSMLSGLKAAQRIYAPLVPASDRVVSLGHNSPEQQQALEKVDEVIAAVKESNDFPGDEETKEQVIAELSAARRILEAARVRLAALSSTLVPPLKWLFEKAAGSIAGKAASAAWDFFAGLHWF